MYLETQQLVKAYRGREVVRGVSISVQKGEIVGLLGKNGAGKTTTFYMVVGLIRPQSGKVFLNGRDITSLPMHRRARLGIGYLAQEPSIFRRMTVEQNLLAILELQPLSPREQRRRAEELMEQLHITALRHQLGITLSGGERRRVEIARSLASNPSFMLLDEPLTGIDPIHVSDIKKIVLSLREQGIGILITDHNARDTLALTDRTYIMAEGQIVTSGPSSELPHDPIARATYLGEDFCM